MINVNIKEITPKYRINDEVSTTEKVAVIKHNGTVEMTISLERNPDMFNTLLMFSQMEPDNITIDFEEYAETRTPMQKYREIKGLTHEQLGDMVGCSRQTIVKVENKTSIPRLTLAVKIADALNMDVRDLL